MRTNSTAQAHNKSTQQSAATKTFRFARPNYTQTPNEYFDEIQRTLKTRGEVLVMNTIIRQTIGWGNKEWDRISITQLMAKTGIARTTVVRAVKALIKKELIIKYIAGRNGEQQVFYKLNIEESEFSDENERENQQNSNKLDQYRFDTGTSIVSIPTKDTITKEKRKEDSPPPTVSPPSSLKEKNMSKELTKEDREQLVRMMGADNADKYQKNALAHIKKCPNSKYAKMKLYEVIVSFYKQDQEISEKIKENAGIDGREFVRKALERNAHLREHVTMNKNDVEIGVSSGVFSNILSYSDPKLEKEVEKLLIKLGKPSVRE